MSTDADWTAENPKLFAEWDCERNGDLRPGDLKGNSSRRVWWSCAGGEDHIWEEALGRRVVAGYGCPYCRGLRVSTTNSLATRRPDIAAEWHPTLNALTTPRDITYGSSTRRVWWRCAQGHEWQATPNSRTATKSGCPYCSGKRVLPETSLAARFPEVSEEWHPTKNRLLTPSEVAPMSSRRVWWLCRRNHTHEWQAAISNRTRGKSGCPQCSVAPESRQEILLKFELALFFQLDPLERKVPLDRGVVDVDVVIPEQRLAIEFDGSFWHRDMDIADTWKSAALRSRGWRVVRVREAPLALTSADDISVPRSLQPKELANRVLLHLRERFTMPMAGLDEYLESDRLQNVDAAERYIDEILLSEDPTARRRVVPKRLSTHMLAWDQAFARLSEYAAAHDGNASPPKAYKCHDGFALGSWVSEQRGRREELSAARRRRLDEIAFCWDVRAGSWEEGFRRLSAYRDWCGHSSPPQSYCDADGYPLGTWVAAQRQRDGRLPAERRRRLDEIDFVWDARSEWLAARHEEWMVGCSHLEAFALREGHVCPAQKHVASEGFRLGAWVNQQRNRFNAGQLTDYQQARLQALGMVWDALDVAWEDGYQHLVRYYDQHGTVYVPSTYADPDDGYELGRWLVRQKATMRLRDIPETRAQRLSEIGLTAVPVGKWELGFEHARRYARGGRTPGAPPEVYVDPDDGYPTGAWVDAQRRALRDGRVSRARVERLNAIGVTPAMNQTDDRWERGYSSLVAYMAENDGRTPSKRFVQVDGFGLGAWVQQQRSRRRQDALDANRIRRLDAAGFEWSPPTGRPRNPGD